MFDFTEVSSIKFDSFMSLFSSLFSIFSESCGGSSKLKFSDFAKSDSFSLISSVNSSSTLFFLSSASSISFSSFSEIVSLLSSSNLLSSNRLDSSSFTFSSSFFSVSFFGSVVSFIFCDSSSLLSLFLSKLFSFSSSVSTSLTL